MITFGRGTDSILADMKLDFHVTNDSAEREGDIEGRMDVILQNFEILSPNVLLSSSCGIFRGFEAENLGKTDEFFFLTAL